MNTLPELLLHILQAIGLGLGVALILWLLRRYAPIRRVQVSALVGALVLGAYLIVRGSNLPGETTVLNILLASAVMLGANTLIQLFDAFLWDYLLGRRRHIAVPRLLVDIFNFVALTTVALAVLNGIFHVNLNALLVTSTVASAVIGLSLQDILGNVLAGVALQLEHPFTVGDWVQINTHTGRVTQMNWRTLILRTRDHHHIILPNANVAKHEIINYSRPTSLQRLHARLGVAYPHPPGLVKQVLTRAVSEVAGVSAAPAPEVTVMAYGDFAIEYDIRYWITDYDQVEQIEDAVLTRLWYSLRRAGLTIPFPTHNIAVRTLAENHEARAHERLQQEVFAELRQLTLFAPLSDAQIGQVASGASLQRFAVGEALVRQGEVGDSLFVIKSGRVRVDKRGEDGQTITVATLGPDEFFGEMSLLTGEPRSAWVIAIEETETIEVDKPDLAAVIASDTPLLEALSTALDERVRNSIEKMLLGTGPLAEKRAPIPRGAFLYRIQQFFGVKSG